MTKKTDKKDDKPEQQSMTIEQCKQLGLDPAAYGLKAAK